MRLGRVASFELLEAVDPSQRRERQRPDADDDEVRRHRRDGRRADRLADEAALERPKAFEPR